jgi:MFS family permease
VLIVGVAVTLVCHAAYIVTSFLPAYATTSLGTSPGWALAALVVASVISMVVLTMTGRRADRTDRRRYAIAGAVLSAALVFPAFAMAALFDGPGLVFGMAGALGGLMLQYAVLPSLLAEQFPVQVRYTGVATCFQLSAVLGGAFLPLGASWLVGHVGGHYWPAAALMIAAAAITQPTRFPWRAVARPSRRLGLCRVRAHRSG